MSNRKWVSQAPVRRWDVREADPDEAASDAGSSDDDEDVEENAKSDPVLAAEMFVDFALSLYFEGKLSAKSLCVLCWWAELAGARQDRIREFSLRPSSSTGHFQRKIDSVLGMTTKDIGMLKVPIPGHTKHDMFRTIEQVPVVPPHEIVERDWTSTRNSFTKLSK